MNRDLQELVYKNLMCPSTREYLYVKNLSLDENGLIENGELSSDKSHKYYISNGVIDFVSFNGSMDQNAYNLYKQSYVDKLIKNGWSFDEVSKMDLLRNNINNLLNSFIRDYAKGIVLEVGAGGSYLRNRFKESLQNWITTDYDLRAKVDIRCDGQSLPFRDNLFDTIICIDVLEHVPNPHQMVTEIVRVLKPGGVLILSTPFFFYLHEAPNDYTRFSKFGLKHLIKCNNMKVIDLRPTGGLISTFGILFTASIVHIFYRYKYLCNFLLLVNKYFQKILEPLDVFVNKSEKFSQGNFIISKKNN